MCKRTWIMMVAVLLAGGLSNGFAADEKVSNMVIEAKEVKMYDSNSAAPSADAGKMAGVDEAKMAEAMKLMQPGENHKNLEPLVGKWTTTSKMWMSPDAPAEESTGSSENTWTMDGRFVKQEFKGQAMGKPFEGVGYIGYDNVKKEYTSVWLDNMSTGIMTGKSQYDPATKTFNEEGTMSCPITGEKDMKVRSVTKVVDDDHMTMEMYGKGPDGKEMKSMEINYERVK